MACPKCGAVVHYEVQGSRITTEVVQRSDKVPRRIREYADKLK